MNRSGRVETETEWRRVVDQLWNTIHKDKGDVAAFPKPADAWERFVKTQRLEEVENESSNSYNIDGVF